MSNDQKKQRWEMTYDEIWKDWESRNNFGAKGELSLSEAKEIHQKWKKLGTEVRLGLI